jgi:hypothetical protein
MAAGRLGIPLPVQGMQEVEDPHTLLFCTPSRRTSDLPSALRGTGYPTNASIFVDAPRTEFANEMTGPRVFELNPYQGGIQ